MIQRGYNCATSQHISMVPIKPSSDRSVSFKEDTGRPIYNTGRPVNLCRLVFYCTTRKCE